MIKDILKDAESRMHNTVEVLKVDLAGIRTGRANPALVEKLHVEYYGAGTPSMQLAAINVPEPRQLLIKPFDPTSLKAIEKAILSSDLGLNPNNDGKQIRLNLPPLATRNADGNWSNTFTVASRKLVAVRNVRRDAMKDMKDAVNEKLCSEDEHKRGEIDLEKIVEKQIQDIEKVGQLVKQPRSWRSNEIDG